MKSLSVKECSFAWERFRNTDVLPALKKEKCNECDHLSRRTRRRGRIRPFSSWHRLTRVPWRSDATIEERTISPEPNLRLDKKGRNIDPMSRPFL